MSLPIRPVSYQSFYAYLQSFAHTSRCICMQLRYFFLLITGELLKVRQLSKPNHYNILLLLGLYLLYFANVKHVQIRSLQNGENISKIEPPPADSCEILSAATETLSEDGSTSNKTTIVGGSTSQAEINQQSLCPEGLHPWASTPIRPIRLVAPLFRPP